MPPSLPLAFLLRPSSLLSGTHKSLNNVDAASGGNEVLMSLRFCPEPLKSFPFVPPSFFEGINLMAGAVFRERALRQEEIKDPITAGVEVGH